MSYQEFGWEELCSDVDYITWGGTFIYKDPVQIGLDRGEEDEWSSGYSDTYIVLEFIDAESGCGEEGKTWISMSLVCPDAPSMEEIERALQCCDEDWDELSRIDKKERIMRLVYCLYSYGLKSDVCMTAVVGHKIPLEHDKEDLEDEDYERKIWESAQKIAQSLSIFVGFDLDRPKNAIGNTGWDFLSGNIGFPVH